MKLKLFAKVSKIQIVAITGGLIAGVACLAVCQVATAGRSVNQPPAQVTTTIAPTPSTTISPVAGASSAPTPASSIKPKPVASPVVCSGTQCGTPVTATPLQIGFLSMWPSQVTCTSNTVKVAFNPLIISRQSGVGNATVQIDYSDGKTSPEIVVPFTNGGPGMQTISGLSHEFIVDPYNVPKAFNYRIRVTGPGPLALTWTSVTTGIHDPIQCELLPTPPAKP